MYIILGARYTRKRAGRTPRARRSYRSPLTVSWLNRYLTPETWGSMCWNKKKKKREGRFYYQIGLYTCIVTGCILRMVWNYQRDNNNVDDLELVRHTEK